MWKEEDGDLVVELGCGQGSHGHVSNVLRCNRPTAHNEQKDNPT